jgi:serine/threonine-protein kinase
LSPDLLGRLQAALAARYELHHELGRGGMATVFLAQDLRHRRPVAIKVLHPELAYALGNDRFLREIEVAANLSHSHILPLFDSGEADGLLYYVMPFVEGESLRVRLLREPQLPIKEALLIAREVAEGLAHAHAHGVIHRDIKPENILLRDGHALIADFGIARAIDDSAERLTGTGLAVGTAAYMSPEQGAGERHLDGRSDVYSLGCVLYEMLAGEPPYTGPTVQAILAKRLRDPIPRVGRIRPTIPPAIERVVTRALATTPVDRYATAGAMARALEEAPLVGVTRVGMRAPSRRLVITTLLLAGAVVIGAFWRRPGKTKGTDPSVVAVAPFRVAGAEPALSYLREGMVDLMAAKLTGQGGPRAADPRAVLSAWRRVSGTDSGDLDQEAALKVAARLGAGQLLLGNVVGTPRRLILNALVLGVADGRRKAQATVEGPQDSLMALIDRLAVTLLTVGAGEAGQRLPVLLSRSLPAIQGYLEGQALYRRGLYEQAIDKFDHALEIDSAFAEAALGRLAAAARTPSPSFTTLEQAEVAAKAARDRLNARDQAFLAYLLCLTNIDTVPYSTMLRNAERFVEAAPDRAEAYMALSDVLMTYGEVLGFPDAHARGGAAARRALELDSTFIPALENLTLIAARAGDTATVRKNRELYGAVDPGRGGYRWVRWRMAVALGDEAAADSLRADFGKTDGVELMGISQLAEYDGVSLNDAALALREWFKRESRGPWRAAVLAEMATNALNRGRPNEAATIRREERAGRLFYLDPLIPAGPFWLSMEVRDGLYWDGDTALAAESARGLARLLEERGGTQRQPSLYTCELEQWRLAHGQRTTAARTIAQLRSVPDTPRNRQIAMTAHGCATFLEALLAAAEQRPDAAARLASADSLMLTGPPYRVFCQSWNLAIARLKEEQGDLAGALAATRRRLWFMADPQFLSTYLREEGRLAALTGDTAGAIRAYRHYLVLRSDPEPALKPQVEHIQAELARLMAPRS